MRYSMFVALSVWLLCFSYCSPANHNKNGVEAAMKYYDHLIQKVDADSIALLYTPDGDLGGIARGRDSIRHFLAAFKNVEVLSQVSNTISIKITSDTAIQKGNYYQTAVINRKDTLKVKGQYVANWQWLKNEGWHIKRMATTPIK